MEKAQVYLFTSVTCPHCPPAKRFMQEFKKTREDAQFVELSTATPEGRHMAQKFDVMSVPTFIIKGPGYPDNIGLAGIQSEKSMNKYIDIALGNRGVDEPKSGLRDKFRDGLKLGKFRFKFH